MPKCPAKPPLCFSRIIFSLIEQSGMHSCPPLNNNFSCRLQPNQGLLSLTKGFWHASQASLKSVSVWYKSRKCSKPSTYTVLSCRSRAFLLSASATLFACPLICFNTKLKLCKYTTHLACLWLSLCCYITYCSAKLSEYSTNSFPNK